MELLLLNNWNRAEGYSLVEQPVSHTAVHTVNNTYCRACSELSPPSCYACRVYRTLFIALCGQGNGGRGAKKFSSCPIAAGALINPQSHALITTSAYATRHAAVERTVAFLNGRIYKEEQLIFTHNIKREIKIILSLLKWAILSKRCQNVFLRFSLILVACYIPAKVTS